MKKLIGILLLLSIFLTGCAGMAAKREVQGNTFYSSQPDLIVKMAPEFKYIDNKNQTESVAIHSEEVSLSKKVEQFIFSDDSDQTGGWVRISTLRNGFFYQNINNGIKNVLESGNENHHGKKYQYCVFVNKNKQGKCALIKRSGRVTGASNNTLLEIYYAERLKDNEPSCGLWKEADMLTRSQEDRLKQFMTNSREKIQFYPEN